MALDYDKLVKFVSKNPEATQREAAESQGLAIGQLSMLQFCNAKVEGGVVDDAPGTSASVKKLRTAGDRWEMIAAKTGKSVAEVKQLFKDGGGDPESSYTGRGRPVGQGTGKKPAAKGKAASTKAAPAKRGRPAGKAAAKPAAGKIQRNRTRRGAGNPS